MSPVGEYVKADGDKRAHEEIDNGSLSVTHNCLLQVLMAG